MRLFTRKQGGLQILYLAGKMAFGISRLVRVDRSDGVGASGCRERLLRFGALLGCGVLSATLLGRALPCFCFRFFPALFFLGTPRSFRFTEPPLFLRSLLGFRLQAALLLFGTLGGFRLSQPTLLGRALPCF